MRGGQKISVHTVLVGSRFHVQMRYESVTRVERDSQGSGQLFALGNREISKRGRFCVVSVS